MSRLIVISNRVRQPGNTAAQGGLAVALSASLRESRGLWLGWSGNMTEKFTGQIAFQEDEGVKTATIDLEEQDIDEYYNGYANRTLWPLFHYRIDLAEYDRTFEGGYNRVNERFADTAIPLIEREDIVWVHDYHLIPLGQMLRDRGLHNRIGFFLHIPWPPTRLLVSLPHHQQLVETLFAYDVVGFQTDEFAAVINRLGADAPVHGFEINVSCPNTKAGGVEFGADPRALKEVVSSARAATSRPLVVKLSPTLADIAGAARMAVDAGADAISVVNTIPGLAIDVERRRPALGFGTGGVSGPGLLPVGVLATWKVRKATSVPIIGVGGISTANAALQYIIAGASLVAVGTAALRDPRMPERLVRDLADWCAENGVESLSDLSGSLEWPT